MFELGTDGPKSILVGVDGSETSMRAGAYAAGLTRRQGAHLYVLYVRSTSSVAAGTAATAGALAQTQEEIGRDLETQLAAYAAEFGLSTTFIQRRGNPYQELIAVAHEMKVDAIVIGASMQAGHRLVGSLATRLVKDAQWPVTVVP